MAVFGGAARRASLGRRRTYLTMNALSLSIWSRETSRRAVEGTPSSSICGRGACRRGVVVRKGVGAFPSRDIAEDASLKRVRGSGVRARRGPRRAVRGFEGAGRTSRRVFLSATSRPVLLSRALYTFPYVPCPIFSSFSYASLMECPIATVCRLRVRCGGARASHAVRAACACATKSGRCARRAGARAYARVEVLRAVAGAPHVRVFPRRGRAEIFRYPEFR